MSNFETTLREQAEGAYRDFILGEDCTPAEADAYAAGQAHTIEQAVKLREVEESLGYDIDLVHGEVRTTFSLEWEQGLRGADDLRIVDETLLREIAVIDSVADCE